MSWANKLFQKKNLFLFYNFYGLDVFLFALFALVLSLSMAFLNSTFNKKCCFFFHARFKILKTLINVSMVIIRIIIMKNIIDNEDVDVVVGCRQAKCQG